MGLYFIFNASAVGEVVKGDTDSVMLEYCSVMGKALFKLLDAGDIHTEQSFLPAKETSSLGRPGCFRKSQESGSQMQSC